MSEEELNRLAKQAAQEVIVAESKTKKFIETFSLIVGTCGVLSGFVFYVMSLEVDGRIDSRVSPIERDIVRIQKDLEYIKKAVERKPIDLR